MLTALLGVVILVWPKETVMVIAVLVGVQLLVAGVFRLVMAFAVDEANTTSRVLLALLGVLLIVVGVLCLRSPFHTVTLLALLLSLTWLVGGVIEGFHGLSFGNGWAVFSGAFSILAGIVVLTFPTSSLVVLTWLFGLVLLVSGVITAIASRRGRASAL